MKTIGLLLSFVFLTSCTGTFHAASEKKIDNLPPIKNINQTAYITIKRDIKTIGGALDGHFLYDGKHIITLSKGEVFKFVANPGVHTLGVKSYQISIILIPIPFHREIEVTFKAGKSYEYLIGSAGFGFGLDVSQIKKI